jgi:hypothetical protein
VERLLPLVILSKANLLRRVGFDLLLSSLNWSDEKMNGCEACSSGVSWPREIQTSALFMPGRENSLKNSRPVFDSHCEETVAVFILTLIWIH